MTSIINKIKNNTHTIQIIDPKSKNIFYCDITNKMLATEHNLNKFLFLSYYQSRDEVKKIYDFAESEYYEESPHGYKKFIIDNVIFKCAMCGFIFDTFPSTDLINNHITMICDKLCTTQFHH